MGRQGPVEIGHARLKAHNVKSPVCRNCFELSKGVLQSEVLGEVCVLEGVNFSRSFSRSFRATSQQKELQQKLLSKSPMPLRSKTGENSRKNFMTRFCRGTPANLGLVESKGMESVSASLAHARVENMPVGEMREPLESRSAC